MRRSVTAAGVVSALLVLAMIPGTALAAKASKVDVCHFDKRAGTLTLTSISASSLGTHLAHGDVLPGEGGYDASCQLVASGRVFARAWADVGVHNQEYDAGTDLLYAELADGNGNDILDAGDVMRVDALPSDFSGGTLALGVTGPRTVTVVAFLETTAVSVITADGWFSFADVPGSSEEYSEDSRQPDGVTSVVDVTTGNSGHSDVISTEDMSPSRPPLSASVEKPEGGDDAWLEVALYTAAP